MRAFWSPYVVKNPPSCARWQGVEQGMFTTLSYVYDVYDDNATISNNSISNNSYADDGEEPFIYNIYVWLFAGVRSCNVRIPKRALTLKHIEPRCTYRYSLGQQLQ